MSQMGTYIPGGGGGGGVLLTLTGNTGGAVPPTANNINVVGTGSITVTGNPGTSTLTISSSGGGVTSITGTANEITASAATGAVTLSIPSNFIAPGSVTATTFVDVPTTASASVGTYQINGVAILHTFGTNNVFCGSPSVFSLTGTNNVFVGAGLGGNLTSGSSNTILGSVAATSLSSGGNITAIGFQTLTNVGTATDCTAVGNTSCGNCTGSFNTALGSLALQSTVALNSANHNIAIGYNTGSKYGTTEAGNICIGAQGVTGDNNSTRIGYVNSTGTTSTQTSCFIDGINGVTVTGAAVLVATTGQLGVAVSSERYKENINDMGSQSEDLYALRPVTFNMKADASKSKSFGLIAEEVYNIIPDLVILDQESKPQSVKYHELPAMLLNELQKLNKRLSALEDIVHGQ